MAEVLITLGIIGVVAAMTMPTLTANYKKKVAVTRMQKFLTTINQAVKLAEVEHGESNGWDEWIGLDGDSTYNIWNKYLNKYYVNTDVTKTADGIYVKSADGSGFLIYNPSDSPSSALNSMHLVFCVNQKACKAHLDSNSNKIYNYPLDGKNTFLFRYMADSKLVTTYLSLNDLDKRNSRELFRDGVNASWSAYGCSSTRKAYCAALIEYDGWEIKDDYPVKF